MFPTACYGLTELARLRPGQSVLVHAATGGVGMSAIQIARHLGADVYATAVAPSGTSCADSESMTRTSPPRGPDFEQGFRAATGGRGVDVVLNSLADDLVDASLRLLTDGGSYVEIGKTDIRDPARVAAAHPGTSYQAFDLADRPGPHPAHAHRPHRPVRAGTLTPLPVTTWDIRAPPRRSASSARPATSASSPSPSPAPSTPTAPS